ncbi:transcriptional regulator [Bacillus sp. M6-12]|uniref:helix-turn-helix domain-containing protein n=1 Tax=Bacillus sp. M6-12 TaxID=2054166 RepID=UPI000C76B137|nr:helix-turn-helix domain-containing protein [Bacillus sp. M6-12]PLS17904.1 transcriptional regulator [Bacillus sp. M6-12]
MIGDRIKKQRLEKNISISQLANQAGIVKSYLSSLERNLQQNPSIQILEKISHVLEIPVEMLLQDKRDNESMDEEWLRLIHEAIDSGVTKDQFRELIASHRKEKI